jgi:N-methylhydantoinase A/oxoprolinase/acetone carboxylase beta subunit
LIVGLDMGGTHVDAAIIRDGEIVDTAKTPVDRSNLFESIWNTLEELLSGKDIARIKRINLSTTVCTNAIVENKTVPVGMVIESGPGLNPDFLKCGKANVFFSGYIDHRGREVQKINPDEMQEALKLFQRKGVQACAVISKFSVRNPLHEKEMASFFQKHFSPVTLGHTISGKLNFPRRVFTSYLNSGIHKTFNEFSESIKTALNDKGIKAPVYVLKADGGTIGLKAAERYPVNTILSGPAASLMGMCALIPTYEDAILLDIGGTTTDIAFLADGISLFEPLGIKIDNYPTLVRAIYSVSIGLGGDSSIRVENKDLVIGPQREGAPMAKGGPKPTPSDAMIVLGLMDFGDKQKAFEAMKQLGEEQGITPETVAKKVVDKMAFMIKEKVDKLVHDINSHPVYTVRELLYGKKLTPKSINMIGGPAKALTSALESLFKIPVKFPKNYDVANAVGAALSRVTTEVSLLADTERQTLAVPEMGIYKKISKSFDIEDAKQMASSLLKQNAHKLGSDETVDVEITEAESFNMVRGFFTSGKNIRVKAQIKPGLVALNRGVQSD